MQTVQSDVHVRAEAPADVAAIRRGVGLDTHRLTHGEPPQTGYQPLRHGGPPSLPHSSFTPSLFTSLDWS